MDSSYSSSECHESESDLGSLEGSYKKSKQRRFSFCSSDIDDGLDSICCGQNEETKSNNHQVKGQNPEER